MKTVTRTVHNARTLYPTTQTVAKNGGVFTSASIVTALSILERGLGFLYRIVLSRMIGGEGMGLYQVALSLFSVFLTLGTGGIPVSVSRFGCKSRAENTPRGANAVFSSGALLSLIFTLPICLIFALFGDKFTFLFSDERTLSVFRILLIGLTISSLYAVVRGSFWGDKKFLLPSVLELAEESVMVIAGVLLLQNVTDPLIGAENAAWAAVVSYIFSFSVSFVCYFVRGGKLANPIPQLKPLFSATLPITSVRLCATLVSSAIAVLFPAMLVRAGATDSTALTLFGVVSGMALPILMIPSTVIGSLSLVLVPELSEDYYKKNVERLYKNIERGVRVALMVAFFLLPFFYALGDDLGRFAYENALAGEIIRKSCPLLLPMSLSMITTGILNSLGFEKQTLLYYLVGAAGTFACIFFLPALCGVYAYIFGMAASFTITSTLNLTLLAKKCKGLFSKYGKTCLLTLAKATLALLPLSIIGKLLATLFSSFLGGVLPAIATAVVLLLLTVAAWSVLRLISIKKLLRWLKKKKV